MNAEQIKKEVRERKDRSVDLCEKIKKYCQQVYGISDLFSFADHLFGTENDGIKLCLSRQVPTINIEHIAHHLLPCWLSSVGVNAQGTSLSFIRDRYASRSKYKHSLVRIPWLRRGKRSVFVQYEYIAKPEEKGEALSSVRVKNNGQFLHEFHACLRQQAFGETESADLSLFFSSLAKECIKNKGRVPTFVYSLENGQEKKILAKSSTQEEDLRPPADWYYFFYLALFVDGRRALLSTVDDDNQVSSWFKKAAEEVELACGAKPFIIYTPSHTEKSKNLLECPIKVLEDGWQEKINLPPLDPSLSVFQALEFLEKQVTSLA